MKTKILVLLVWALPSFASISFTLTPDGKTAMITINDFDDKNKDAMKLYEALNLPETAAGYGVGKDYEFDDTSLYIKCGKAPFGDMGGTCSFAVRAGTHSKISAGYAEWILEEENHPLTEVFLKNSNSFDYQTTGGKVKIHVTPERFEFRYN